MIVLETLLGLIIIYLLFCAVIAISDHPNIERETGFIEFSYVIGIIVITLVVISSIILLAYLIGNALLG